MRIRTAGVITAVVATLLVAGCDRDDPTIRPSASATGGGTLVVWADDRRAAALAPLAAAYGKRRGITVEVRAVSTDLQAGVVAATQSGQAPDIVLGPHDWIGNLAGNGIIEPVALSDSQRGQFAEVAVKAVTFNNQVYGVPYAIETIGLIRNTDLAPVPPATIEEVVSIGRQLQVAGKVTDILSLPVGPAGDLRSSYPLYFSAGGYLFGVKASGEYDARDLGIGTPASISAFNRIAGLGVKGSGALSPRITAQSALATFASGRSAYLVAGPEAIGAIKQNHLRYDVTPLPGFAGGRPAPSLVSVESFFVLSKGRHKQVAQDFVATAVTRVDLARALYAAEPRTPALTAALEQVRSADPDTQRFLDIAKAGAIVPPIAAMAAVWEPFGIAEAAVLTGADVPASVAAAAQAIAAKTG